MMNTVFNFNIVIEDGDIDHLAHVNNAAYIKWIQSAVMAHWEHYAPLPVQNDNLWIAVRHEIDYQKQSFRDDDLVAEITLCKVRAVRSIYESTIKRGEDIIASAISTWCCIHPETHRPKRIGHDVLAAFKPALPS